MPLKIYKNKETGEIKETLKVIDDPQWEEQITIPSTKFMVCVNSETGKSKLKDMDKILKARARNHSRDVNLDDVIQTNKAVDGTEANVQRALLNNKGKRRTKLDDI